MSLNIRVEIINKITSAEKDDFAYGSDVIPSEHWYKYKTVYEPTGEFGTLLQVRQSEGNQYGPKVLVLTDDGAFIEFDDLEMIRKAD